MDNQINYECKASQFKLTILRNPTTEQIRDFFEEKDFTLVYVEHRYAAYGVEYEEKLPARNELASGLLKVPVYGDILISAAEPFFDKIPTPPSKTRRESDGVFVL